MAVFAIWAVHSLTKRRDREKAVFDLYKTVADSASALKPIIIKVWETGDKEDRRVAVAETNWRLQQIGGFVERIRRQSRRWGWRGALNPRPLGGQPYPYPEPDAFWFAAERTRARLSLAGRWMFKWGRHLAWAPRWRIEIRLTRPMALLRDSITRDPFDDPDRAADKTKNAEVELVIGGFLQDMDVALFAWMDGGR